MQTKIAVEMHPNRLTGAIFKYVLLIKVKSYTNREIEPIS